MKLLPALIMLNLLLLTGSCTNNGQSAVALNSDEDYGIGGTGMSAQNSQQRAMGVLGQITGFGSIFVNGIEIEPGTNISVNGQPMDQYRFSIGEVVEVLTTDDSRYTQALQINVRHEVSGPVSFISADKSRLTVLNQSVINHVSNAVKVGDYISVAGFRNSAGEIYATHITAAEAGKALLRGRATAQHSLLQIHGVTLDLAPQPQLLNSKLMVEGRLEGNRVTVTRTTVDNVLPFAGVSRWVIQGYPENYRMLWSEHEGFNTLSGQREPIIFEVSHQQQITPTRLKQLPDNYPKGSSRRSQQQPSGSGLPAPVQRSVSPAGSHGKR